MLIGVCTFKARQGCVRCPAIWPAKLTGKKSHDISSRQTHRHDSVRIYIEAEMLVWLGLPGCRAARLSVSRHPREFGDVDRRLQRERSPPWPRAGELDRWAGKRGQRQHVAPLLARFAVRRFKPGHELRLASFITPCPLHPSCRSDMTG